MYRTETGLGEKWKLAYPVRYQHAADCKTYSRAGVVAQQAEFIRVDLVKGGLTAERAYALVNLNSDYKRITEMITPLLFHVFYYKFCNSFQLHSTEKRMLQIIGCDCDNRKLLKSLKHLII